MTNDIDIMREILDEYKEANRLKKMNYELLSHLQGVYYWLFKYSEQNNIPLPKKEQLWHMAEKADFLIDQISTPTRRKFTGIRSDGDLTEPNWDLPTKKKNFCARCGFETSSKKPRLSDEGTFEIFCKDCRELGLSE